MLNVAKTIGTICITEEDGARLYDLIHPSLKTNQRVDLDFSGGVVLSSPFLNAAIGNLLADVPLKTVESNLVFHHLEPTDRALVKRVVENADHIYSDPAYGENVKRVILHEMGEDGYAIHL